VSLYPQIEIPCPRCDGTGTHEGDPNDVCRQCEGDGIAVAPDSHTEVVFRLIDMIAKLELIWNKVK